VILDYLIIVGKEGGMVTVRLMSDKPQFVDGFVSTICGSG
jgi:hypothetical protein